MPFPSPDILPVHVSNLCLLSLLHWHVDSLPLSHQGSPWFSHSAALLLNLSPSPCHSATGRPPPHGEAGTEQFWLLLHPLVYHLFSPQQLYKFWRGRRGPCTCRILTPRPETEPVPPAVEAWSLNHWTDREVPTLVLKMECHGNHNENHLRKQGNHLGTCYALLSSRTQLSIL